jgi:hypothetical protein
MSTTTITEELIQQLVDAVTLRLNSQLEVIRDRLVDDDYTRVDNLSVTSDPAPPAPPAPDALLTMVHKAMAGGQRTTTIEVPEELHCQVADVLNTLRHEGRYECYHQEGTIVVTAKPTLLERILKDPPTGTRSGQSWRLHPQDNAELTMKMLAARGFRCEVMSGELFVSRPFTKGVSAPADILSSDDPRTTLILAVEKKLRSAPLSKSVVVDVDCRINKVTEDVAEEVVLAYRSMGWKAVCYNSAIFIAYYDAATPPSVKAVFNSILTKVLILGYAAEVVFLPDNASAEELQKMLSMVGVTLTLLDDGCAIAKRDGC